MSNITADELETKLKRIEAANRGRVAVGIQLYAKYFED